MWGGATVRGPRARHGFDEKEKQSVILLRYKAHCEAIYLQGSRARSKRTRPRSLTAHTADSAPYVYDHVVRGSHYCSASQRVGRFAHAPASVAEGRRTRRTKPSTTLPQSAPHHVRKAGLIRALGHGGGRILFRHSAHTTRHGALDASRDAWPTCTHGVPALSPRYGHDLHVASMARPLSRYAVEIRLSAQYSGSVASPAGCKRACVRVRACVRACARREWRGRGATMPQVAGRQSLPPCHCGGEPSKSSSVSSCSSSSISSSPPSS